MRFSILTIVVLAIVGLSTSNPVKFPSPVLVQYGEESFEMIPIGNFSRLNPVSGKAEEVYWFTTSIKLVGDNANKVCESTIGGAAASLEDAVKNNAAKRYMDSHQIAAAWTSGNDFDANGKFVWQKLPGGPVPFKYSDFYQDPGFPNPSCSCVSIEILPGCVAPCNGQLRWRERPCHEKKKLLCELA